MGKNNIGQFLSSATKNLPLSASGKFTNHSVRKTCIKTLLDSGLSHNNVAQLSGHKSLKSLDSYAVASHQQQRQMSKILSGKETPGPNQRQKQRRKNRKISQVVPFKSPSKQIAYFQERASLWLTSRILSFLKPLVRNTLHKFQLWRRVAVMLSNLQTKRTAEFLCNRRSRYIITLLLDFVSYIVYKFEWGYYI